jgi:carboxyl-terminal processing protease
MPDYFVPLDTSTNSTYFNRLFNANVLREFAFNYSQRNEKTLQQMGFEKYRQDFVVTDAMLSQVVEMGKRAKVDPRPAELQAKKKIFQIYLKAEIARRIWKNEGFFPIINEDNEILQQAVKLFDRIPDLNRQKM